MKHVLQTVLLVFAFAGTAAGQVAIINEYSQGASGAREWVEILVTSTAPNYSAVDLRGFRLGELAPVGSNNFLTFTTNAVWQAVPAGTLIVIYNGGDIDATISGLTPPDLDATDFRLLIPHSNTTYFSAGTGLNWPGGGQFGNGTDGPTLYNASATLEHAPPYASVTGTFPGANQAFRYDGGAGNFTTAGSFTSDFGSASATPGTGNGGTNSAFVTFLQGFLPVTWTSVAARREAAAGAKVSWTVASELNNERFEVQRSASERFSSFTTVARVSGRGTSTEAFGYTIIDGDVPSTGRTYYRIRQVDYDGTSSLSPIAALDGVANWSVYPNPITGPLNVVGVGLTDASEPVALQLLSNDGRLLVDAMLPAAQLGARLDAALVNAAAGLYVIRVGGRTVRVVKP